MANQQVVVSVLGDTKHFSRAMSSSSKIMAAFGVAVTAAMFTAGRAFADFVSDSVTAAEDATAVSRRFEQMAEQSGLFGKATRLVTASLQEYARQQSFVTGIDDEAIIAAETKVLAFRKVAKSAGQVGGVFQRTITISQDLAAVLGGTGDGLAKIETIAPKVARALENPARNMRTLARMGIELTDAERKKVIELQKTSGLYAAQDFLLGKLEERYSGSAEAGAKASDKIKARFEDLQEQVGAKLLPSIEGIADKFGEWLDGEAGQAAIDEFVRSFEKLGDWLANPQTIKNLEKLASSTAKIASALSAVFDAIDKFTGLPRWLTEALFGKGFTNDFKNTWDKIENYVAPSGGNTTAPGGVRPSGAPVVVNFNVPVDSVSAGREVVRAVDAYNRSRGRVFG